MNKKLWGVLFARCGRLNAGISGDKQQDSAVKFAGGSKHNCTQDSRNEWNGVIGDERDRIGCQRMGSRTRAMKSSG